MTRTLSWLLLLLFSCLLEAQDPTEINYIPDYTLTVTWSLPAGTNLANLIVECSGDAAAGVYSLKSIPTTMALTGVTLKELKMCIDYNCRLRDTVAITDLRTFPVKILPPIPALKSLDVKQITQGGFNFFYTKETNIDETKCGKITYAYQLMQGTNIIQKVDDVADTEGSFNNLYPKTVYKIMVRAVLKNYNAMGSWLEKQVTTFDGIVNPPTNLRQLPDIQVTGNEYIVEWDPPTNDKNYQLFYKIRAVDDSDTSVKEYESYDTDKLLDDLKFCSSYSTTVAAGTTPLVNAPTIFSANSNVHTFKTEFPAELGPVMNVASKQVALTSVEVTFDQQEILKKNPKCTFTNHVIVYDANGVELPNFETISKENKIKVNNLDPEKSYKFNVITKSADGSVVSTLDPNRQSSLKMEKIADYGTTGEGALKWWHILLIVLGVLLVLAVILSIIF